MYKEGVTRRKYCLAYRQGAIGIETTEIESMHQNVKESEIESKKSSQNRAKGASCR